MASLETIGGLHYEMMRRCYNENCIAFKGYGGIGIKVCEEWHDREKFIQWCKANGYEKGLRLNRIDSSKDYCPENCVFGKKNCKIEGGINQNNKNRNKENKRKKAELGIVGRMDNDPIYFVFHGMHSRCERNTHTSYENYGARGITVCKEWTGKHAFYEFKKWANENGWVEGATLDRIDNEKGYSPSNCRWVTRKIQNNNKRNNIVYEYCGKEMTLGDIAKIEKVKYGLLYSRVRQKGLSIEEALAQIKSGN